MSRLDPPSAAARGVAMIKEVGSFHIGGRNVSVAGLPPVESVFTRGAAPTRIDPNGDVEAEQLYVQYFIPAVQRSTYPLLMWHGGGLTGVTWETKPDGEPGWLQYFLGAGHPVYVSDAVERGRASWSRYPEICPGQPVFRTKQEAWELFRIGAPGTYASEPARRVAFAGTRFPVAAFDQFAKQFVPRWTCNDAATQRAYDALVARIGGAVLLFHSQAGNFGFAAALAQPDKVKGLIAVEPAGAPPPGPALDALAGIPVLFLWGDYLDQYPVWRRQLPASRAFAADLAARGGDVLWLELPKRGIAGNSHMLMMDTNSDEIAGFVLDWMGRRGLMA
jgi:pimeloyl-ACP methyl ester carboxylesterase